MAGYIRWYIHYCRAVLRYAKATRLRYEERFAEALEVIEDWGPELPSYLRVRIYLLKGVLYGRENQYELAHKFFLAAFTEAPQITKHYSKQDILYMRSYASHMGILVAKLLGRSEEPFEVSYEKIDLNTVSGELLRCFRLTQHPKWHDSLGRRAR